MKIVGLTGKTGSGKSTASKILESKGYFIIDGDKAAREIVSPGSPALKELENCFGKDIIDENGFLNRSLLAKKAFSSRQNTEKLNAVTHPFITKLILEKAKYAKDEGYKVCVIDAAALLESEIKNYCDIIAVVYAPEETRLKRIVSRDNLSEEDAKIRMSAQKSDEYYASHADIMIMNYGGFDIENELHKLIDLAEEK